jgi:hypothetical protein
VPAWDEVNVLLYALDGALPPGTDVSSISFSADSRVVTIWTKTPGLILGRRGSTAALIREALSSASGSRIELHVVEVKEPPEDPLGGVREPRHPFPSEPTSGAERQGQETEGK